MCSAVQHVHSLGRRLKCGHRSELEDKGSEELSVSVITGLDVNG